VWDPLRLFATGRFACRRRTKSPALPEPPAIEGTMLIVSPSLVGVFSLFRKRMSSSFKYTFTKLRIFPSSVKRCFFNSENVPVRLPSASPTVAALHSMLDCFPVNWRSGVGIRTFTAMGRFSSLIKTSL
jgi:hypothetical protein